MSEKAILALKDGMIFEGRALGAIGEATGEVVFNTSMTGYQEITTDPSYKGQIVAMTYPLIGNVGCNEEDFESARPQVEGFIVREASRAPSSWRSRMSFDAYLKAWGIVGIEGIDTRALTKHIRTVGAMDGVLSSVDLDRGSLMEKARAVPSLIGRDLVREVTCQEPYGWEQALWSLKDGYAGPGEARHRVVMEIIGRSISGAICTGRRVRLSKPKILSRMQATATAVGLPREALVKIMA
ncbi:MAG: hypothetical protein IH788_01575 [Nitrospinae bacterium]|nr:hypothetical protein [Nitrospinota bacterium]